MAKRKEQPKKPSDEVTQGAGRTDSFDSTKGIFPFDAPHPANAETRMPGELGGAKYEESGRSGLDTMLEPEGMGEMSEERLRALDEDEKELLRKQTEENEKRPLAGTLPPAEEKSPRR